MLQEHASFLVVLGAGHHGDVHTTLVIDRIRIDLVEHGLLGEAKVVVALTIELVAVDALVAEMKKRGMHLIMDLVVNHCSDKHEWFQKALADPDGPYAGYFYFREGKDGKAPSNYRSYFGGSAWTKVPGTNKYYLHTFAKEQPDLNWENPVVRKKIYEMINWWFEKGISGFRIDAIINIKKNLDFPSFPADGDDAAPGLRAADRTVPPARPSQSLRRPSDIPVWL